MTRLKLGVLAEDDTDCDVIDALARRLLPNVSLSVHRRRGGGCSMLRRKAEIWMQQLADEGCSSLVLLHDLDRDPVNDELRDERELRLLLSRIPRPRGVEHLLCIPIEELEAWFWSDQKLVSEIGRGKGKAHPSPHRIRKPKEALIRLSRDLGRKPLYSTNDNKQLAQKLDLDTCAKCCPSFRDLRDFVLRMTTASSKRRGSLNRKRS